ncbi:MAG: ATP-binding protein [Chloroflexota bacterium]
MHASLQDLEFILRHSPDQSRLAYWEADADGLIVSVSGAEFPHIGLRRSAVGSLLQDAFSDTPILLEGFRRARNGVADASILHMWERIYRAIQVPTRYGVSGTVIDITEHTEVEETLLKSERSLQASYQLGAVTSGPSTLGEILWEALEAAARCIQAEKGAIFLLDPASGDLSLAEVYGFSNENLPEIFHLDLYQSQTGHAVRARHPIVTDFHHPDEYPYDALRPLVRDEGIRSIAAAPLLSGSEALGAVTLFSTQTDKFRFSDQYLLTLIGSQLGAAVHRARYYELLQQERDQLQQKVDEQTSELRHSNEAMQRLLSMVGHELQQPVAAILKLSHSLNRSTENVLNARQARQLNGIRSSARHMSTMVSDIMDVSRIQRGDLSLSVEEYGLNELLARVQEEVRPRLDAKSQALTVASPEGSIVARLDLDRILQVLHNLLSNASKYSPERSTVSLSACAEGDDLVFEVEDEGYGMAEKDRAKVFEPFFRSDNSNVRSERGYGIGLSIVNTLVELHGGNISVESELGEGSMFTVRLPGAVR